MKALSVNNKRKYAMNVTVVQALSGRGIHQVKDFVFESFEQEPYTIDKDGKQQFLTAFKKRLEIDPEMNRLIGGTRYKIRTANLRTA